jgi:hypothetical protein
MVAVDKDAKQAYSLDTSDSDFIPGYQYEGTNGVG